MWSEAFSSKAWEIPPTCICWLVLIVIFGFIRVGGNQSDISLVMLEILYNCSMFPYILHTFSSSGGVDAYVVFVKHDWLICLSSGIKIIMPQRNCSINDSIRSKSLSSQDMVKM
jgi:hypothetical protein